MKLGEMINFWKYDEGGNSPRDQVKTKFFEGTPNPYAMTYETYNKTMTLPQCGKMNSDFAGKSYTFDAAKYDQFKRTTNI